MTSTTPTPTPSTSSTTTTTTTQTSPTTETSTSVKHKLKTKDKPSFTRRSLNLAHLIRNHSLQSPLIKTPLKTTPSQLTNPLQHISKNELKKISTQSLKSFACPVCDRPLSFDSNETTHQTCNICGTIWDSPNSFIINQPNRSFYQTSPHPANLKITQELLAHLQALSLTPEQLEIFDRNPSNYLGNLAKENPIEFDRCQEFHQLILPLISDLFSSISNLSNAFSIQQPSLTPSINIINRFFQLICDAPGGRDILCSALEQFLLRPIPQMVSIVASWKPHFPVTPVSDEDEYIEWAWVTILLQCPLLQPSSKIHQQKRLAMTARLLGFISFMPNRLHQQLIKFYGSSQEDTCMAQVLRQKVELVNVFISERINYFLQVPNGFGPPSQPLSPSSPGQKHPQDSLSQLPKYTEDWSLLAASRVMTLLFESNAESRKLPVETFYNVSIDLIQESDLIFDFEIWETQRSKYYTLCGYPSLLSLSSKIIILTYEGKRQMGMEARQAIFDSLIRHSLAPPVLVLNIRRSHLLMDSLRQISVAENELKKLIKINFVDEDGVDGGGLKKEWFLLLTRQLVGPEYGMFIHDEDNHQIWFNPASTEFEEFKLIGTILGLAIYNRVTLDIGLPSIVYRKLFGHKVGGLKDLWTLKPEVAKGLKWLLEYEQDDLEEICNRNFVAEYEAFGTIVEVPLIKGGEKISVNRSNRNQFVELYCDFILNQSVEEQFKAFKEGFQKTTRANGFSLFQPSEIELLLIGSNYQSKLSVQDLQTITSYEGFDPKKDLTIKLFWKVVNEFSYEDQKKLLRFITGSDRIPAIGLTGLTLKITKSSSSSVASTSSNSNANGKRKNSIISNDNPGRERLPESHTCFNQLILDQFNDFYHLDLKLRLAINESEGFGLS